jgi:hypothetical protein
MDWWLILKFIWGGMTLGAAAMVSVIAWRARGIISWNRAIRKELKALGQDCKRASPARQSAIETILTRCLAIYRSPAPKVGGLEDLRQYVRTIAACFFPEAEKPELQISLGDIIHSIDGTLNRFNRILMRPGLSRIQGINIRTIRKIYHWSEELLHNRLFAWYFKHRSKLRYLTGVRLVILPDPFSWLAFLSQRLVTLILVKHLLVDVYLFTGKLALAAYDRVTESSMEEDNNVLVDTLEELYGMEEPKAANQDPQILEIRNRLVGFPGLMISDPTWEQWKSAIQDAAKLTAGKYFPASDNPMEEAAVGPLLYRTQSLLGTLAKGEGIAIVRYIYKTRLAILFQAKDLSDLMLPPLARKVIRKTFQAYGWLKWPLKAYRWSRRTTLPGMAISIGWILGKKSALALIYGRSFDQVCEELDLVYRLSKNIRENGPGRNFQPTNGHKADS